MHQKTFLFQVLFAVTVAQLLLWPSVVADTQYLRLVPLMDGHPGMRNLACVSAGTLLYQGLADGGWAPVEPVDPLAVRNLLSFDPAARVDLATGTREFLLAFSDLERADRLAFWNRGTGGRVGIYAADAPYPMDSPRWKPLSPVTEMGSEALVDLGFPLESMRFLRLRFESPESGAVGPVFLSGDTFSGETEAPIPPMDQWPDSPNWAEYDFARTAAGGRIAYIGSGNVEDSYRMVDSDPTTFFEFDAADGDGFLVLALAEVYPVFQASIVTTEPIGSVEIWSFTGLPDEFFTGELSDGEPGVLAIPSGFLEQRPAAGRVEVPEDEVVSFLTIPLPESTARYLLVRVAGKLPDQPIRISMFSVLGRVPEEYLGNRGNRPVFVQPMAEPLDLMDPPRVQFASP